MATSVSPDKNICLHFTSFHSFSFSFGVSDPVFFFFQHFDMQACLSLAYWSKQEMIYRVWECGFVLFKINYICLVITFTY